MDNSGSRDSLSRRRFLRTVGGLTVVSGLAGCFSTDQTDTPPEGDETSSPESEDPQTNTQDGQSSTKTSVPIEGEWEHAYLDHQNTLFQQGVTGPTNPELQWSANVNGSNTGYLQRDLSEAILRDGVLYFSNAKGHLYALDAMTGEEKWRCDTQPTDRVTAPVVSDDLILASFSEDIFAVEKESGDLQWTFSTGAWAQQPVTNGETVYVGSLDGRYYGIQKSDGRDLGYAELGLSLSRPTLFSPIVHDESIYDVLGDTVFEISMEAIRNGDSTEWSHEYDPVDDLSLYHSGVLGPHPNSDQDVLHLTGGDIRSLNIETGEIVDQAGAPDNLLIGIDQSGIAGATSEEGFFYAHFTDDEQSWTLSAGDGRGVTITDDYVFGTLESELVRINKDSGVIDWTLEIDDELRGPPVVTDNYIFVKGAQIHGIAGG